MDYYHCTLHSLSCCIGYLECMNNQRTTSSLKIGVDAQGVSANTRPHQLRWGDREMGTVISYTECSQMAGLIQKVGSVSSKAPSLRAAVFRSKIVRSYRNPCSSSSLGSLYIQSVYNEPKISTLPSYIAPQTQAYISYPT